MPEGYRAGREASIAEPGKKSRESERDGLTRPPRQDTKQVMALTNHDLQEALGCLILLAACLCLGGAIWAYAWKAASTGLVVVASPVPAVRTWTPTELRILEARSRPAFLHIYLAATPKNHRSPPR